MLGKTFKGLTDKMLAWQTGRLLELAGPGQASEPTGGAAGHVVRVRPELVVEIAFDGIQTSRRYPGGIALRFARVLRYRPDKKGSRCGHDRRRACRRAAQRAGLSRPPLPASRAQRPGPQPVIAAYRGWLPGPQPVVLVAVQRLRESSRSTSTVPGRASDVSRDARLTAGRRRPWRNRSGPGA